MQRSSAWFYRLGGSDSAASGRSASDPSANTASEPQESVSQDETPFECWLYVNSWHLRQDRTFFQPNIDTYAQLIPDFDIGSPAENSIKMHVRFSSDGVNNSRNVQLLSRQTQVLIPGKDSLDVSVDHLRIIYGSLFRILVCALVITLNMRVRE